MEWSGEGVIVSVRKYGETSAIIDVFTTLQPGSQVTVEWRARLEEHLGSYRVEPLESRSDLFDDRLRLSALSSICSIICFAFPERMALPALYNSTLDVMDRLNADQDWKASYALWELQVLEEMGFGLDLTQCAVTGATQEQGRQPRGGWRMGGSIVAAARFHAKRI